MGLYKILLVDDEAEIREGMLKKIDWNVLGFEVAGAAENGLEALDILEQCPVDIILTDIKMPFMDGLEFIERAIKILPAVKIIVFSGFDDFEYAKRAIQLKAEEYLLKPIDAKMLRETLEKVKIKMDEELEDKRNVDLLRKNYEESFPIMREQFLVNLIEGQASKDHIIARANQYEINTRAHFWTVVLINYDINFFAAENGLKSVFKGKEELIPFSLRQTVDRLLKRFHKFHSFLYGEQIAVIVELEWESQISQLMNEVNEACKEAKRIIGIDVTAGIGGIYADLADVKCAYKEAATALEYSMIMNQEIMAVVYIKDVEPDGSVSIKFGEAEERSLANAVKLGGAGKIEESINALFVEFEQVLLPINQYQIYVIEVFTYVLRIVNNYNLNMEKIFGVETNYAATILELHSLSNMKRWLTKTCIKISALVQKERQDSGQGLSNRAKELVQEQYTDASLSVEKICDVLHVSPAYFSTVFKRETKMSFVSYLTEVRLMQAIKLLDTTLDKTYVIAAAVGYTEPNYFSYVFKKKYGVSPSKYRNRE